MKITAEQWAQFQNSLKNKPVRKPGYSSFLAGSSYGGSPYWSASSSTSSSDFFSNTMNNIMGPRSEFLAQNIVSRVSPQIDPKTGTSTSPTSSIAIFFDVTGSMADIPEKFINGPLLTLVQEISKRQTIAEPEIMFGAVGDLECDSFPLQATNFNTDIKAAEELRDLYLEGGGGGNSYEHYTAAWLFAARKTKPCSLTQGHKGILFTIGDEKYPAFIPNSLIERHLGIKGNSQTGNMSAEEILKEVQEKYEVFHLNIEFTANAAYSSYDQEKNQMWNSLLGERVIPVKRNDINKVSEIMVSIIERYFGGLTQDVIVASWQDKSVQAAVGHAIQNLGTLAARADSADLEKADADAINKFLMLNRFNTDPKNINNFISNGHTPLTLAVKYGNYPLAYALVQRNHADINATMANGDSPLHVALTQRNDGNKDRMDAIIQWLVHAGAWLDVGNKAGVTAESLATQKGMVLEKVAVNKNVITSGPQLLAN